MTQDMTEMIFGERDIECETKQGNSPRVLRTSVFRNLSFLMVFLTFGAMSVWGQTDFSGTYYIANETNHTSGNYGTHWYLVPGADPHATHYADAYFSDEYCNQSGKGDYKTSYGDPEKPFLTTYQTNQDLNSIWIISSAGDGSYYIKHAKTGKYIIYEPPYKDAIQRKSMHLESTDSPGENAKFTITGSLSGPNNISPKSVTSGNMYFNPATGVGNRLQYYASGGDYLHDGMIGLWNAPGDKSQWYLEKTTIPPTITYDEETGMATITSITGTTIHYVFDNGTPTSSSTTYTEPVSMAGHTSIKAIAVDAENTKSNVVTLTLKEYTYHILNKAWTTAIKHTIKQPVGKAITDTYTSIPAAIRSPYLEDEEVKFYNNSDHTDEHKISETPSTGTGDIYVTYTTAHLEDKYLHLRGARALNITINGAYVYDSGTNDAGVLSHTSNNAGIATSPYLWFFSGEDPYAIEIKNAGTNNYLGYTTPSTLSLGSSPANKKFIIMATSGSGDYQQMELMAATGDGNYYRVGRTDGDPYISTTATGDAAQVRAYPNSATVKYELIDQAGKIIMEISSKSESAELPGEWQSPLVGKYNYWKVGAFDTYGTGDNTVYKLKADPEPYRITTLTGLEGDQIYVTYEVNDRIVFDISDDDKTHNALYPTYMLKFYQGESFNQENGKDGIEGSEQQAEYPYSNGDAMLYVYSDTKRANQFASGASTRPRWLWYAVSPKAAKVNDTEITPGYKGDPYHVKIMSHSADVKSKSNSDVKHQNFFRTYLVNYGGSNHVVTGLTTKHADVDGAAPTEYMVLNAPNDRFKLVTLNEIEGAPENGTYGTRQTVNTFEQYWKNNPTVQNKLTNKVSASESTDDDGIELTADQISQLPENWHTYQKWAQAAPWVKWSEDGKSGKQYHNKYHWFQTIDMGSTGEFTFEAQSIDPEVILLDQHGWEIMRAPLSEAAALRKYDSPMVEEYQWYPTAAKVTGYHKYKVSDPNIPVYYSYTDANGKTKWASTGESVTFTSTTLGADPYAYMVEKGYEAQDKSVKTDFYITYTVKPEYAGLYSGAATESGVTPSAFLVKQGNEYAKINGSNQLDPTTDNPYNLESIGDEWHWYVKPNFNIDTEMGYEYDVEEDDGSGGTFTPNKAQKEALNYEEGRNGFDPYNVQIQSVKSPTYYFKSHTTGSHLANGAWEGSSTDLSLKNMSVDGQANVEGNDQTTLAVTNATFMVVKDANGNMLLMPRFDHTKVVNSFTAPRLSAANAADQSLELLMAPKIIHSSAELLSMNGQYTLADDFTFESGFESLGSETNPFTGSIDGALHAITGLSTPLIAYADGAIIKNVILNNVTIGNEEDVPNVGAIAANATGETRIYNCGILSGSISGTGNAGSIVGNLDGISRVINCYSYANVSGTTNTGGIVGYNAVANVSSTNIKTMVMNCMFYGDVTGGKVSPIYGGEIIDNLGINNSQKQGLSNFNYYAYEKATSFNALKDNNANKVYNNALAIEERFLTRFEIYRQLLNSNRKLAAYYATSEEETVKASDMMKWVLETADRSIDNPKEYPILKAQAKYPSIINYDIENAPDSASVGRNHGGKLGRTLTVHLSGTGITTPSLTLQRMDKDFDHFNFNYDKVQLPYFNDVGTGNYTNNQVVTGWKITSITSVAGDPYTSANYPSTGIKDYPDHNYADRKSSNKDLYSVSGRVFSQGAYFDVPYGVSEITIEPYWATAAYVADEYMDVAYETGWTGHGVTQLGKQFPTGKITINGSEQTVYKSISDALKYNTSSSSVYDLAIVLVGNLHSNDVPSNGSVPFTVMSVDLDHDNEPDYSYIYSHGKRAKVSPIRFDFINVPGTAQAQKPRGATQLRNAAIFNTIGWFELTNTASMYFSQIEYENNDQSQKAPMILQGGVVDQFVSTVSHKVDGDNIYIHVGGNVWFKSFTMGTHGDGSESTPHVPVSVTGGDYDSFYLTGMYNSNAAVRDDNAECYISGGRFGEVAGAGQEQIGKSGGTSNGNVHWQIYNADISEFYGGGINEAKPVQGNIQTDIFNSYVEKFCGGPKFGNMATGKTVLTNATGCTFGKYFGAGNGGNSYSRKKYYDQEGVPNESTWSTLNGYYTTDKGKFFDGTTTGSSQIANKNYGKKGYGVATDFDYEFFVWTSGTAGVRLYVNFASFSLAQCNDVTSNLTNCIINHDFYGGGNLGSVVGTATSTLNGCTVHGNVFGGGYSAELPKIPVRSAGFTKYPNFNTNSGMFEPGTFSNTNDYDWKHVENDPANGTAGTESDQYVKTKANLDALGQVAHTDLTVTNNCLIDGSVFGGGDMSAVNENTLVKIENVKTSGDTQNTISNVYGGGNTADVLGNAEVRMTSGTVSHDIYGGGKGQITTVSGDVTVNFGTKTTEPSVSYSGTGLVNGNIYGGSALGAVNATKDPSTGDLSYTDGKKTEVNIYAGTIAGSAFGGGLGHDDEDNTKDVAAQNFGNTTVTLENSDNSKVTVKTAVYGGSNENGVLKRKSTVTITGGTVGTPPEENNPITNVVFGGGKGQPTLVNGDVEVNIGTKSAGETPVYTGTAIINGHVYGGSALGNTNEEWVTNTSTEPARTTLEPVANTKTDVNLYAGTIYGNVFGGGLGQKTGVNGATSDILSYVGGDVNVTLDGAKLNIAYTGTKDENGDTRVFTSGQIFGCNNLNGTPKGHVKVDVMRTVNTDSEKNNLKNNSETALNDRKTYDIAAVYGGGNQADYNPTKALGTDDEKEDAFAEVNIEGCAKTSIEFVYGGGNAAAVPATQITINSAYIIDQVFGGGNGAGANNPGADVGVIDKEAYAADNTAGIYGTGKAVTKLKGGQVHVLYGGSNTKGNVRGGTSLKRNENSDCTLKIGEIYGAGQVAPMDGDVNIVLECMPEDFVPQVFGGAKNATVNGNVSLTVTSGKFGRVFGGNNEGGSINGSITVNVYEDGCQPLIIGELYGGGFNAPYSIWGCNDSDNDGTWTPNTPSEYPHVAEDADAVSVNVYSCTSIGKVFGGGYGSTADVVGNTHVWINTMQGIVNGNKKTYETTPENVYIGKIGQVFGGGNAAPVKGNVTIDIGTATVNQEHSTGQDAEKIGIRIIDGTYLKPDNTDLTIDAGIYGGGFSADVDGDVTMNIGTVSQNQGINIGGDIFGGGFGEKTTVTGSVVINIGTDASGTPVGYATITGDVYGGSAKGKVNATKGGTTESPTFTPTEGKTTQVNLYGGDLSGNLYGGGLGESTHAADVYGGVTVNVKGGSAYNVFGCNNVNGTPKSDVTVNINGGAISQSVYGGGNQAIMDGSPVVNVTGGTIGTENKGGAVYGNVYGGGLGSDGTGEQSDLDKVKAGLVKGNTEINISGGTILHNIYGGGAYGSVGTFSYDNTTTLPTGLATENTGKATINITGGTFGSDGHNNGMVFGSSRGDIDAINAIHDKLAWVYDTDVKIGTQNDATAGPQINGSLYGGGENGHVFNDASVTMYSGTVGNMEEYYANRGNVYGGGCGTDLYYPGAIPEGHTKHDGEGDYYNPKAGIVGHDAKVEIKGGSVANNIYGAGSMGKVGGSTSVIIDTDGSIGVDGNHDDGNVYGAARGELNLKENHLIREEDNPDDFSSVMHSSVEIKNGTVKGSVFGGGKAGIVKGNVDVTVTGGVVKNDVYGGGALANTNTLNWNASANTWSDISTGTYYAEVKHLVKGSSSVNGFFTRSGSEPSYTYTSATGTAAENTKYYKKLENFLNVAANGTTYKTTVSLTGGTIGNAYGGGLGRFAEAAVGTPGNPGYVAAVEAVEAMVYGDVTLTVDGTKFTIESERVDGKTIPTTGRVFGCNNKNGTPKGSVLVRVNQTKRLDDGTHVKNQFEVQAVYGGGNMANYVPNTDSYDIPTEFGRKTQVLIQDCNTTSIERVYGGGNASNVPFTDVIIDGSFQIGYVFGGGNGGDKINKGTGAGWEENPGANVTHYTNVLLNAGTIGDAFGGSDSKGSVGGSELKNGSGDCPLVINNIYGASKEADSDGDVILDLSGCGRGEVDKVFGGSYNANVRGNVTINITSGIYTSVFGGNDRKGSIGGNITINIEEVDDCNPIIIQNLFGGGSQADYPGADAKYVTNEKDGSGHYTGAGVTFDENTGKYTGLTYADFTSGTITLNIKAATRIDNVFGGCDNAKATGNTAVNINMVKGSRAGGRFTLPSTYTGKAIPTVHAEEAYVVVTGLTDNVSSVTGYYERSGSEGSYVYTLTEDTKAQNGKTYCEHFTHVIDDAIGTIGNVYGGGNQGDVDGNTTVNIGSLKDVAFEKTPAHLTPNASSKYDVLGAVITGDVFGGGNQGEVSGNTTVNIQTADYSTPPTGFVGVNINNGSVYGGGNSADVLGNTNVTMSGGYVFNGIFGGGYSGSVGTFTERSTSVTDYGHVANHAGCIGKPTECQSGTGKCTVVVNGGQIGPVTVATVGMDPTNAHGGPVPQGWVWGGGCGVVEDPAANPDTHFKTYVGSTDVTIGGTAFIMEGVIGGGEFGRVLGNTLVKITGGQIGVGENQTEDGGLKPKRYEEAQFINPLTTTVTTDNALPECSHYDYKSPFSPYDPYFAEYDSPAEYAPASTATPSDGKTWIGVVFGGGSGYMPYKKAGGSGYDWCRSAGWVEGDAEVRISGGHILTNVYGGNEYTDVKGKCTVTMTGGTIGVPRTLEQIAKHPVTCYLFGGGKGDQRSHFNTMTNVGSVEVDVSGGIIYGSVFGGSEDGHVLGNASVTVRKGDSYSVGGNPITTGPIIGTWGTSYVDGNVFGGGRGFSGTSLTTGSVEGNVTMTISGGNILGNVYGGGRMASVGIDFMDIDTPSYGQLIDDETGVDPKTYGHITMNISGGTIGGGRAGSPSDLAANYYDEKHSGNVFGGSMGRLTLLDGTTNSLWPKMSIVKTTSITISDGADIKRNVYGGGELGIVRNQATINIEGGTVRGNVFGGGYGSSDNQTRTTITPAGYAGTYYTFTPMMWAGCVSGNTEVNISDGTVENCVYGGGELASVGLIDFISDASGNFTNMPKHESLTDGFGLSWPYKFTYHAADPKDTSKDGKATVNITGGTIGTKDGDNYVGETGYIYGGCKGKVSFGATDGIEQQRYTEALIANVRETEVNIGTKGGSAATPVIRTAYGGGEDGHVIEDAKVTVYHGTVDRSIFGGGKGTSTFTTTLLNPTTGNPKGSTESAHSWTAGKVYGNTSVVMYGGTVGWFIYGGGNMASVGKGNYSGGADDYSKDGYGETLTGSLWTNTDFLNSGKATVTILGGTLGTSTAGFHPTYGVPYGSIFGGSRGQAARDVSTLTDAYKYVPDFFTGFVNKAVINIGGYKCNAANNGYAVGDGITNEQFKLIPAGDASKWDKVGPTNIYGSIYGGCQDGHVRDSTEVVIFKGSIDGQTSDTDGRSGHVFGAGSGIGKYMDGVISYCNDASGSVFGSTKVEVYDDATIAGNVYGGGALASVGPKTIGTKNEQKAASADHASYSHNLVNIKGGSIGGSVYGASRGPGSVMFSGVPPTFSGIGTSAGEYDPTKFATSIWTEVNVTGGTIANNVYGGGEMGRVKESTEVNLKGGKVTHDAYGGGQGTRGTNAIEANVIGNTTVELNKGVTDKGCVVDKIFGCNDLNGSPKGHVTVHVYATQNSTTGNVSTKVAPAAYSPSRGASEDYLVYLRRILDEAYKKDGEGVVITPETRVSDRINSDTLTRVEALYTYMNTVGETNLTASHKSGITAAAKHVIVELEKQHDYDVTAVYGGGDLAPYVPTNNADKTEVIIEGCDVTSIKQVYGGGNAASVPATDVLVKEAFIIGELFGGGNGKDNYTIDNKWYENPGANVGYSQMAHYDTGGSYGNGESEGTKYTAIANTSSSPSPYNKDASTPENRRANYAYGTGVATTTVNGGRIHNVYGGSNEKGNIRGEALTNYQQIGDCTMITDSVYGGSKSAEIDATINVTLDCVKEGGTFFGGSYQANINSDVNINITNGTYDKIFGGNDRAGTINGKITINIEEYGCTPIRITELYAGGNLAPYSVYGYKKDGEGNYITRLAQDKDGNNVAGLYQRVPAKAGETSDATTPYRDPQINIISATEIGTIFGGGYGAGATMIGNPHINVNMTKGKIRSSHVSDDPSYASLEDATDGDKYLPLGTIGSIYGGGNLADVIGDTYVEIGTGKHLNIDGVEEIITPARNNATITGNVFGGGKGEATVSGTTAFSCAKAMIGEVDSGEGSTSVIIGNALIKGSVYGGGEIGRVESNTSVTIGIENNTTDTLTIKGNVFGAGQGIETHGYSGLTRGNSTVIVQGKAKVLGSVYGGGEMATVGRYWLNTTPLADGAPAVPAGTPAGFPYALRSGGLCTVTIRDDAEIGPDDMIMTKVGGPDNTGHVFGAGKGVMPSVYTYDDNEHKPWHIDGTGTKVYSANETAYLGFVETLGLASSTNVTIDENAFVKGDVFGGAEQGFVQSNTHVTIDGNSQIGNGYVQMDDDGKYLDELEPSVTKMAVNRRYSADEWTEGHLITVDSDPTALKTLAATYYKNSLPECASWKYKSPYASHDMFANAEGELEQYSDGSSTYGGRRMATSGRTFYGNVFGGGSGYFPYKAGKWHWKAGNVGGNTLVEIKGGHVLTNVYGANEMTNVDGKATVKMTGGTIGVPRTVGQIMKHPVTCYLFGGGAGDPRVLFNKQTNVQDVEVIIEGGWIYGSVFGGGEDGHVMRDVAMNISDGAKIGTWGTSYVDGNVFGGGRGFAADAYTAGNVAGSVDLTIDGGEILGSVYGGGRLGSVGYGLFAEDETDGYGKMRDDNDIETGYSTEGFFTKGRGHVDITINGGTIGNNHEYVIPSTADNTAAGITANKAVADWDATDWTNWKKYKNIPNTEFVYDADLKLYRLSHTKGGNVFAGGMGRMYQLDGTTPISAVDWWKLGNVKSTKLTINGGTIKSNVYGGSELGMTQGTHVVKDADGNAIKDTNDKDVVASTEVIVSGGSIGTKLTGTVSVPAVDANDPAISVNNVTRYTYGSVFGGGYGSTVESLTPTGKAVSYPKYIAGRVKGGTRVTMTGGEVLASVFGGGDMAAVGESTALGETLTNGLVGDTYVNISGGTIGIDKTVLTEGKGDTIRYGGATMGNVYGGGNGYRLTVRSGHIYGNTNVSISGTPTIYHNIYGGGAYGTVGDFEYTTSTNVEGYVGIPKVVDVKGLHTGHAATGTTNVTITGGTIGVDGHENGMVFGSSRGDITNPEARDDFLAWVNDANVTIGDEAKGTTNSGDGKTIDTPLVKGSVYGSGENGHTFNNTLLNIHSGTIGNSSEYYAYRGNVYGGGCGTDTYTDNGVERYNKWAGIVRGNTTVNIDGGLITGCVYGAGAMASVGTITNATDTATVAKHADIVNPGTSTEVIRGFALSWPYEFKFKENTGKATINITGGHIGVDGTDGGDVYGSGRGEAADRYVMAHHAFVNEAEVNVKLPSTADPSAIGTLTTPCITGSVHGSGENGYVYSDTHVMLSGGLIGHSLYGGGKGKDTYKKNVPILSGTNAGKNKERKIYGLLSGKVLGNTYVTMTGGHVVRNVYGGGNIASVGKGNYAGGTDDYYPAGYGETLHDAVLWTPTTGFKPNEPITASNKPTTMADYFLSSGKTNVRVIGGQVGTKEPKYKDGLPYGNVLGGSAGEAAPNISELPRYLYSPAFFSGYVNETDVTIGGYRCKTANGTYKVGDGITTAEYDALASGKDNWEKSGPTILGSVYGGGQDGHVRRDTKVTVNDGEIGMPYNQTNQGLLETDNLDDPQWLYRGNIFGGGSGVNKYNYDFNGDGDYEDEVTYGGQATKEEDFSNSAGSVTRFTTVDVKGGTIHRNVYGGGSMGSVGAPKIDQTYDPYKPGQANITDKPVNVPGRQSMNTVIIGGGTGTVTIGTPDDYQVHYGGEVYGACRGDATLDADQFGTSIWTQVLIKNGANILGNVYGGGDNGKVKKDTDVQIGAE